MTKKFDVVIGNPPYQDEAVGDSTHNMPIYDKFMDAAYEVGHKAVLVTPARFLFNAGYTPKAWNERMLADPHLSVPFYVRNSADLFPGTKIRAGIAITYRDDDTTGDPIGVFTPYPQLNSIVQRLQALGVESISGEITSSRSYRYTEAMHVEHPLAAKAMAKGEEFKINTRTFELLPFLYHSERPADGYEYRQMLGVIKNKRFIRWIRCNYVSGPDSLDTYKVAVPAANELNTLGQMASPQVLGPGAGVTQTFLTIGSFETQGEADACFSYVKTKFARVMLYVLKVTQHNPRSTWKYVPNQDFTDASDIDWSKTIPEIDQQLYAKYRLDADEIAFIEDNVKPME